MAAAGSTACRRMSTAVCQLKSRLWLNEYAPAVGKIERGSLHWEPRTLSLTFTLSDGKASVPVRHTGAPPDLFGESRGAVVEGSWSADGYFRATQIMAKHSEEYKAPHDTSQAGVKALMRTLSRTSQ